MELGDRTGIIFQQSPEEEAFQRWQRGEFLQIERSQAKRWRNHLSTIDLEENYRTFHKFFPLGKPKTLDDVKRFVDFYLAGPDQEALLRLGFSMQSIPEIGQRNVLARWSTAGKPPVTTFAPYFAHVLSVDLFFNLGLAADLIGRGRPSHTVDLAYLYYLPFCMVFTSNDKLHADIAPFFLRSDQSFVPGTELKADLGKLDAHYDLLPAETKERGVMSFAAYPPFDTMFLVTRLWDKHMSPRWREHQKSTAPKPESPEAKAIIEEIRRFEESATRAESKSRFTSDEADQLVIKRKALRAHHQKAGKFPPSFVELALGVWRNRQSLKLGEDGRSVSVANYYYIYSAIDSGACTLWAIPVNRRRDEGSTFFLALSPENSTPLEGSGSGIR
jgi:hypothetical protein